MSKIKLVLLAILISAVLGGGFAYFNFLQRRTSDIPLIKTGEITPALQDALKDAPRLSALASNLQIPWALVFLPDKSILFTERAGAIRIIDSKGNLNPNPVASINEVKHSGEGGLLGITIHPDFDSNHFVYLYYTYSSNGNDTLNRVVRFKFEENALSEKSIIVDKIPGALFHNGGRIKFGPDGFLYIATGDSQNPSLAQNINSLAGKILRVDSDGKPASDNPFNNAVFSYGHRNPQGITWDENNTLWETEHGASTLDELNIIERGKNYGWPEIRGDQKKNGMETPIANSGSQTWAPSGTAYLNGSIFFAGLRGEALFEYNIESKIFTLHLKGEIGRIREVVAGPDNLLYITTSNRDGRGIPDSTDDKIIRVNPDKL